MLICGLPLKALEKVVVTFWAKVGIGGKAEIILVVVVGGAMEPGPPSLSLARNWLSVLFCNGKKRS